MLVLLLATLVLAMPLAALAVWFQTTGLVRVVALAALAAAVLATLTLVLRGQPGAGWLVALATIGLVAAWWATIRPSNERIWAADVAHGVTATIAGDDVTLHHVRNFDWHSEDEATERWEDRRYRLDQITGVDLFSSVWSNPAIAHTLIGFSFADGQRVVFSAEIRREKGEAFSEIGGFFKQFELVLIAADERDIIRLRTNERRESVSLFPLELTPEQRRALFLSFAGLGNELARAPRFYQTVTTNCTTVIFRLARLIEPGVAFDWRILLSGYLPGYLYEQELIATDAPLAEVERRAAITPLGQAAGDAPDYSERIRRR
ncbi:DUF4105 domain-containing protein [Ancylobacter oerskovii]|uniref:DUF4105 domain-containing protein n=1 Tax=Ancylobacter oerskovii TaxID=459519 RepID=A0ABW4YVB4_9HYPH|nr:DUF4105 domain-containing protein [Ancylobacter oerskovii]MBS7544394.1 DUF4105 domain-containing protein [Ancylobacter oerskovii]